MNLSERKQLFDGFVKDQRKILVDKCIDYAAGRSDEDANANFKIIADLLSGSPINEYTVGMVYFLKHVLSIITYAKTGRQESGESLRGRHLDIANYAFILNSMSDDSVPIDEPLIGDHGYAANSTEEILIPDKIPESVLQFMRGDDLDMPDDYAEQLLSASEGDCVYSKKEDKWVEVNNELATRLMAMQAEAEKRHDV